MLVAERIADRLEGKVVARPEKRDVRHTIICKAGDPPPSLKSESSPFPERGIASRSAGRPHEDVLLGRREARLAGHFADEPIGVEVDLPVVVVVAVRPHG